MKNLHRLCFLYMINGLNAIVVHLVTARAPILPNAPINTLYKSHVQRSTQFFFFFFDITFEIT